jgi:hypothetical protein
MADTLKVLGQLAAAATTAETLYTAPSLSTVTVSTLMICNRTAATITFRTNIDVGGLGDDVKQYLFYDTPIDGNTSVSVTIGITMAEADLVRTWASAEGLTFTLFGAETT